MLRGDHERQRFGVGIDLERISRFRLLDRMRDALFLRRVYTPRELTYCFSNKDAAPHLAARFCAKEAVMKAMGVLGASMPRHTAIDVIVRPKRAPLVRLHGRAYTPFSAVISLSHDHDTAAAVAVVTRTPRSSL